MSQPEFMLFALIQAPDMKLFFSFPFFLPLGRSPAPLLQQRDMPDLAPNPVTTNSLHDFGQPRPSHRLVSQFYRETQPRRLS